ncbi:MAG: nucleotidyltransferase domain-containing protein [Prosthecobacter sp.]|uniref:nucleotidyltransferase domain-containing protein n=1 Tax=Prosthecobacter sp. TaxID=1965333 RepID=UPI00260158DA|nr:nucleotidyltransferase domain-containing protein [Prosthecobacter sp.]MCF7787855.1 nucleotidyltransferase domain-containing protein [Prosthecobacter sp.]
MKTNDVSQRVRGALNRLEAEQDVRVLYACESGSRAWGFASHDSDYDVRFLYVHRREWYLSIESRRDVIEEPLSDGLDVSGWELRKALRLLRKSNPPLLEWMKSPVVYHHDPIFTQEFEELAGMFYSPRRCFAHYLHMASGNWKSYLEGRDQVSLKKYLYVLRPLLACRWIERSLGQVPMIFQDLVDAVLDEREVRDALAVLVARKKAGDELGKSAPDEVLSRFIVTELQRLKALNDPEDVMGDMDELDIFFRRYALSA